ncbi:MAG: hypothetical protein EOO75_06840 [Myxococcales bacterium]|nr:MAG: hypothetical protein EOO75_06840 [Myxococcales bacterium]
MNRWSILGGLALVLVSINGLIAHKERVLSDGAMVLIPLAPVDPRSLIQGDYMRLSYDLRAVRDLDQDGHLVLRVDADRVATADRVHRPGEPLGPGEQLIRARPRQGQVRLGAEAFHFQEGQASLYEKARYGELRVTPAGASVLVGLRDLDRRPLGPPR